MFHNSKPNTDLFCKEQGRCKILIIRFSALGDVAMTIPVIQSMAAAYPMHEISVLSVIALKPLFDYLPNVRFIGADLKHRHKGVSGLTLLFNELKMEKFDYVADFHSVLRSSYLRMRFALGGAKTACIDKGRFEKKQLTCKNNKRLMPLKSSFERYHDVLAKLGFNFKIEFNTVLSQSEHECLAITPIAGEKGTQRWIGIAPFAKHKGKIYPLELQAKVIACFSNDPKYKVFVFGGGKTEKDIVDSWVETYPSLISLVGKLTLDQELVLMSQLDLMLSMDSANMHLASLVGTRVVSVWGATHPYAGFMGWGQNPELALQIDLPCRPCSVYGQKACYRGDYACMYSIQPEMIIKCVNKILNSNSVNN